MKTYSKGVRGEREILHYLNYKGFSVCRIPSSGSYISPVDVIAMKKGLILGLEVKTHKEKPRLKKKQLQSFKKWCKNAGAFAFLAWRAPNNKWLFLRIEDAEQNRYGDENWLEMSQFLSTFGFK